MSKLQKATLTVLLLPYLALFVWFVVADWDRLATRPMELVVTLLFCGIIPLLAAFIMRRSRSQSQRRYYVAVGVLSLPLLLVAVVKTFGETVPVDGPTGYRGGVPSQLEF